MPMLQRAETPTQFITNVTRQIILAMRDVFDSGLFSPDFPGGINVVNSYPLTQVQYPAIIVSFDPSVNETAGVGHQEDFADLDGQMRTWQHRRFDGSISFTAVTLDPMERDILGDAVNDVLTFSHFTDNQVLAAFFTRMEQTPDAIGTVFQVNVNSDRVVPGSASVTVAPWEPEDVLLYERTYTVSVMGGYYNTVLADWPGYIMDYYINDPFMETLSIDVPLPPEPSETPSVDQLGQAQDRATVARS